MGWSYWDDYNERNTDTEPRPEPTPEELKRRSDQAHQAKIRKKKRDEFKKKFHLTGGQEKRLYNKGHCNIDELLSMNPRELQIELRKKWRGKNDDLSMNILGA